MRLKQVLSAVEAKDRLACKGQHQVCRSEPGEDDVERGRGVFSEGGGFQQSEMR